MRPPIVATLLIVLSGCSTTGLPEPRAPYLAVRGQRLVSGAGALDRSMVHAYVVWRKAADDGPRVSEFMGSIHHAMPTSWDADDETYQVLRGGDALAAIRRVERARVDLPTRELGEPVRGYVLWPGPNSNTYVALLCRRARIPVELPPTAWGKDWPDAIPHLFAFHASTTGLGVQLDVGVFGLQVGLVEG